MKMDMNKFARDNDLARKFEKAIETIDNGSGWEVFAGLDKGSVVILVVYDGTVRFVPFKKVAKKKAKPKAKPKEEEPPEGLPLEMKVDPEANKENPEEG